MVMKLHTGVPGSGKSYLLIKSFVDLFCSWDKDTERYVLKSEHQNKVLISNIEGLTLKHLDIETLMSERCEQLARIKFISNIGKFGVDEMHDVVDEYYREFMQEKVRWFFDFEYQKHLAATHGSVIYLIEESQRYFDTKELGRQKWVRDTLFFFEKHRHLGFSIFMDTQHISKLQKGISVLFEEEIRAKPRTMSVSGEFRYNSYVEGSKVNLVPIVVKPSKRIFKTYKSMARKEVVKTNKPLLKIVAFVVFMACLGFGALEWAKNEIGPDKLQASELKKNQIYQSSLANIKKEWVRITHIMDSKGKVNILHPIYNIVLPLVDFEYEVKVVGTSLFAFIPVIKE